MRLGPRAVFRPARWRTVHVGDLDPARADAVDAGGIGDHGPGRVPAAVAGRVDLPAVLDDPGPDAGDRDALVRGPDRNSPAIHHHHRTAGCGDGPGRDLQR